MKALSPLTAVLTLGLWVTAAHGDGGTMLLHQDAGGFTITLFASPQPLAAAAADLSVMVQDRQSGEVLLDPMVDLTISPEGGNAQQQTVRLTKGLANDRLLQAATVRFSHPGKWRLTLLVRRADEVAQLSTECTVEPDGSRTTLVWFYVLLPIAVILLFVVHQALKFRSGGKAS